MSKVCREFDIEERLIDFAVRVIRTAESLPKTKIGNRIYSQLIRSGTSLCGICVERSWKDWLVYLDVTNFLDKDYEKYRGRSGAERIFRLGLQRTTSCPLTFILSASTCHRP